ncbi:MAG: YfcC family protein, partial [Saprospiraceae bacterium]|nr:YfcC family protein [Saprospiraceae bacterium]
MERKINDNSEISRGNKFLTKIPHAIVILFGIIIFVTFLTYLLPAGQYERQLVNGRQSVVPNSYKIIESTSVSLFQMFKAIPLGFKSAVDIIFIVLAGGIMFGIMEKSKAIENTIGTLVKKMGVKRKFMIVTIITFVYGFLGIAV